MQTTCPEGPQGSGSDLVSDAENPQMTLVANSAVGSHYFLLGRYQYFYTIGNSVIIRPHRSTTYVDAAYCLLPSSVVCRSVGRSVCRCGSVTLVSPAETVTPIEIPFGLMTRLGPGEPCVRWTSRSPWEGAMFRGEGASHCKV